MVVFIIRLQLLTFSHNLFMICLYLFKRMGIPCMLILSRMTLFVIV